MTTSQAIAARLAVLRKEFDNSFAHAPREINAATENLLAIRLGGVAHAIRVAQIGGLYVDRHIMPLPTPASELLGVAAFRGQLAPVYDLSALLGYVRHQASRWLVLLRMQDAVAFTFDNFDAHIAAQAEDILRADYHSYNVERAARPHIGDAVRTADGILPIIDLHSIVNDIKRQYLPMTATTANSAKTKGSHHE